MTNEVKRLWLGPSTTILTTNTAQILARADEVLRNEVFPELQKLLEEYCIGQERQTLSASQSRYAVPERAFNGQVRRVNWRQSASAEDYAELDFIAPADSHNHSSAGGVVGYYVEGDDIVIVGTPAGVIDVHYPVAPGLLVASSDYRTVTAVNAGSNQITVDSAPTWAAGNKLDVIDSKRSGQPRYLSIEVQGVAGSNITFTTEIAGATFGTRAIQVGDMVAAAGYAGRPMVPEGIHGAIAQGVVELIAQSQGDVEQWQVAHSKFESVLKRQLSDLDRRVDQKRPVVNYNSRFRRYGFVPRRRRRFML